MVHGVPSNLGYYYSDQGGSSRSRSRSRGGNASSLYAPCVSYSSPISSASSVPSLLLVCSIDFRFYLSAGRLACLLAWLVGKEPAPSVSMPVHWWCLFEIGRGNILPVVQYCFPPTESASPKQLPIVDTVVATRASGELERPGGPLSFRR